VSKSVDDAVRNIIRHYRQWKGRDPEKLFFTKQSYVDLYSEYSATTTRAIFGAVETPDGILTRTVYDIPIVITDSLKFDKNGCEILVVST